MKSAEEETQIFERFLNKLQESLQLDSAVTFLVLEFVTNFICQCLNYPTHFNQNGFYCDNCKKGNYYFLNTRHENIRVYVNQLKQKKDYKIADFHIKKAQILVEQITNAVAFKQTYLETQQLYILNQSYKLIQKNKNQLQSLLKRACQQSTPSIVQYPITQKPPTQQLQYIEELQKKMKFFQKIDIQKFSKEVAITKQEFQTRLLCSPGIQFLSTSQTHPIFSYFNFPQELLDIRGHRNKIIEQPIKFKGCFPYFKPVGCTRFGIRVLTGWPEDDQWLQGKSMQWAVVYHGVKDPVGFLKDKSVLLSILKEGFLIGPGQSYKDSNCVLRNNQKVGEGVYCSPNASICFGGYSKSFEVIMQDGSVKYYSIVLQCRANPTAIKICNYETYWVLNNSSSIRPYGILLLEKGKSVKQKLFSLSQWKSQILDQLDWIHRKK